MSAGLKFNAAAAGLANGLGRGWHVAINQKIMSELVKKS
jgi:hypothetical protein